MLSSTAGEEPNQVPLGLIVTPSVYCECSNVEQVDARPAQQSEAGHRSAGARGTEFGEYALEARIVRDATLLTFD